MTATTPRPATLPVNAAGLPTTAPFDRDQYVTWDWWEKPGRPGEWTKPPFRPLDGRKASHAKCEDWASRDQALAAMRRRGHAGISFVLTSDLGMVGLDWDKCRDPHTGSLASWAAEWAARFNTRTEITPSGTGLRLFLFGALPEYIADGGTKRDGREVYSQLRHLTLTGHLLPGSPATVEPRQGVLDAFLAEYFPAPGPKPPPVPPRPIDLDDAEPIARACAWDDGGKFDDLFAGRARFNDPSRNDWHLAWHGAFLFGGDPTRVERMMRASGLAREKWDERRGQTTLLGYTVAKACREQTAFYDPLRPHRTPPPPSGEAPEGEPPPHTAPPAGDDPRAAYRAMSHEDLAALAVELAAALVARDRSLAAERRRADQAAEMLANVMQIRRNKHIRVERDTLVAVTVAYDAAEKDEDGFARMPLAAIGDATGKAAKTASEHIDLGRDWGLWERKLVTDRYVDADTGKVTLKPTTRVKLLSTPQQTLRKLVTIAPPPATKKGETWGGKRDACPHCGSERRVTRTYCADCGELLDPGEPVVPVESPKMTDTAQKEETWAEIMGVEVPEGGAGVARPVSPKMDPLSTSITGGGVSSPVSPKLGDTGRRCAVPGCDNEAEPGGRWCGECRAGNYPRLRRPEAA